MRSLLASALFALGCSFALAALRGGESALRLLGASQLVDDLDNARDVARDR